MKREGGGDNQLSKAFKKFVAANILNKLSHILFKCYLVRSQ